MQEIRQSRHSVIHIHRWVLWWIYIGIACGVVAVVNILFRHLTHTQESVILILGVVNWCMGGLICWATEGIRIEQQGPAAPLPHHPAQPPKPPPEKEWHSASEFRLPGAGRLLLRFPYKPGSRETTDHYRSLRNHQRRSQHA